MINLKYQLHQKVKATLGSGDLTGAIKLPAGEDMNEWLAVNSTIILISIFFFFSFFPFLIDKIKYSINNNNSVQV